jgi:hypothetical protein
MTTNNKLNPSAGPSTFPRRTTEVPTHPGVAQSKETEKKDVDKLANHLAHKANEREQEFEGDNSNLFSK